MKQQASKKLGLPPTEVQEENSNPHVRAMTDKLTKPLIDVDEARRELLALVEINNEEEPL